MFLLAGSVFYWFGGTIQTLDASTMLARHICPGYSCACYDSFLTVFHFCNTEGQDKVALTNTGCGVGDPLVASYLV